MLIACLAWGSLVWRPEGLPVHKPWFDDGPLLPVEFARQSKGGLITLVLVSGHKRVRSLWAPMSVDELEAAKSQLAEREEIKTENIPKYIGWWSRNSDSTGPFIATVKEWAAHRTVEAVIWTALPPKFDDMEGRVPKADELVTFLRRLPYDKRRQAEEYVRRAPLQIDTEYRRVMEAELGWRPLRTDDRLGPGDRYRCD
jgi:hypothetical protein